MIKELPGTTSIAISAISVLFSSVVSLMYLLNRPHLTGNQKLVALLVGMATGVPTGGLLAIVVVAAIYLPACSSGCHFSEAESTYWMVFAPLSIATGVAVMVAASVADRKAQQSSPSSDE